MYIKLLDVEKKIKRNLIYKINYCFYSGEVYCILSDDSYYKDMFLRIISGLVRINNGIIDVNGHVLYMDEPYPCPISVMFSDDFNSKRGTLFDNNISYNMDRVRNLKSIGVNPFDKRNINDFSADTKKRIKISECLSKNADVYIINDITKNINNKIDNNIVNVLRSNALRDKIVIITCDDIDFAKKVSDNILIVDDNKKLIDCNIDFRGRKYS